MKDYSCLTIILLLLFFVAINALVFWGCQELWNWVAPLFWKNAPILTYWQAAGCVILLELIGRCFKSTSTKNS